MELKTGDVLFCSGKKLLARAIKFLTKSDYSHTAIYIEIWGQQYIIDAQKNGVNVKEFGRWQELYGYEFTVMRNPKLSESNIREFSLRAMSMSGVTFYDFESLIIRQPIQLITGKWKKKYDETDRMYCSEYVAWAHGLTHYYRLSPQNLYAICVRDKWAIVE